MARFADIHIHMLHGVDDGAKSSDEMKEMLSLAYADGTRVICLTPHFHPGYFGDNREGVNTAFRELKAIAAQEYPDLRLALGNELRYSPSCLDWLAQGYCKTLNGTDKVLVDFSQSVEARIVIDAAYRLLNAGYTPVMAHVERYDKLHWTFREILQLKDCGAIIQIDSGSLFGSWGFSARQRSRRLLDRGLVDLVCSDAHGVTNRPPQLSPAYQYTEKRCGKEYADRIFYGNALKVLEID